MSKRDDVVIKSADKGGKIVLMERKQYINECEKLLKSDFYQPVQEDPNDILPAKIQSLTDNILKENHISKNEHQFLTQDLKNPRIPVF